MAAFDMGGTGDGAADTAPAKAGRRGRGHISAGAPGYPPPAPGRVTSAHRVMSLADTLGRATTAALATVDLTPTQYSVLSWAATGEPMHQRALAAAVGIDPADLVGHLDHLQALRLISRERDPRDRRRQIVSATRSGAILLDHAERILEQTFARSLGPLPAADRTSLSQLLGRLDDDRPADQA